MKNVNFGYNETQPTTQSNKGGRPTANKTRQQKEIAHNLYKKNISQKEIAKQLNTTEKTICKWAKEWKEAKTIEFNTITNLKKRLLEMTTDEQTSITDIKNLVSIIQQFENN